MPEKNYCGIDMDATCKRIGFFIKVSGYTDRELGMTLKTSVQSVNKWRHAHNFPDIENIYILSRVFGVSLDDLIVPCDKKEEKTLMDVSGRAAAYKAFLRLILAAGRRKYLVREMENSSGELIYDHELNLRQHFRDYTQNGLDLCFGQ